MQEKLLAATTEAVIEIASTMLFMEISPTSSGDGPGSVPCDISAVVGYSGAIRGSVILTGPLTSALKLASGLMGEPIEEMNNDAKDGFAELCNMIAGGVQSRLSAELGAINISPPVVVDGSHHRLTGKQGERVIHQTFETEGCAFVVEIMFLT